MPVPLTIRGTTYQYPVEGEPPNWGGEATAWSEAVTEVLNTLLGQGDIVISVFSPIADNQTSALDITGLQFDTALANGFRVVYYVTRTSSADDLTEFGQLFGVYDIDSSTWLINKFGSSGEAGIDFSIDSSGQIKYTTSNLGGTGYTGSIKFKAESL